MIQNLNKNKLMKHSPLICSLENYLKLKNHVSLFYDSLNRVLF